MLNGYVQGQFFFFLVKLCIRTIVLAEVILFYNYVGFRLLAK